ELKRDVVVPPLEELVVGEWNLPGLLQLFTELEFNLLVEKVKMKMPPSDDMVVVAAPEATPVAAVETRQDTRVVVRPEAIAEVVDDTMLAAFLLDPTQEAEPGEAVAKRLGSVLLPERVTIAGKAKHSLEGVEVERAAPWAGAITHSLLPISEQLPARLENGG